MIFVGDYFALGLVFVLCMFYFDKKNIAHYVSKSSRLYIACLFFTILTALTDLITLQLLELPGRIKLVVQTPSVRMHETILNMLQTNRETLWALDRKRIPADRPFDVTYSFYEELRQHIVLTTHPIPMLILHGEEDSYIRMSDIQQFHRINEDSKLVIIPGTSHRFLEEGAWDMVLDLTRDWFEFEQVLLADCE